MSTNVSISCDDAGLVIGVLLGRAGEWRTLANWWRTQPPGFSRESEREMRIERAVAFAIECEAVAMRIESAVGK